MANPEMLANIEHSTCTLALRPRQMAAALGVSTRTLWAWTKAGQIPHVRRGGTVLYPVDAVRRWLDEQSAISGHGGGQ